MPPFRSIAPVVARVAAGTLGAYGLTHAAVALLVAAAHRAGLAFGEASALGLMLGLLLLLAAFCWSFTAESIVRVWLVFGAVAATAAMAARFLVGWRIG